MKPGDVVESIENPLFTWKVVEVHGDTFTAQILDKRGTLIPVSGSQYRLPTKEYRLMSDDPDGRR